MLVMKSQPGPTSYTQGTGVEFDFSEYEGVRNAIVSASPQYKGGGFQNELKVIISGKKVNVLIYKQNVTATSPTWNEENAGVDWSTHNFTIIADVH